MPMLQSTGVASLIAAVRGFFIVQSTLIFLFQEGGSYSDINVSPGQEFIQGALAVGIEAGLKPALLESAQPILIIKVLPPGVKGAAQLPGTIDNLT